MDVLFHKTEVILYFYTTHLAEVYSLCVRSLTNLYAGIIRAPHSIAFPHSPNSIAASKACSRNRSQKLSIQIN